MDPTLRSSIFDRSEGTCDLCGRAVDPNAWECHHRKLRSRGGRDSHANLVCLHPGCHAWVHQNPIEATENGFMVPSGADPAAVPVRRFLAYFVYPSGTRWGTTPPNN